MIRKLVSLSILIHFVNSVVFAQEFVAPLDHNVQLFGETSKKNMAHKTTANVLPFFEDFTDYFVFPDVSKWVDHSVYLNNTMGIDVISRGVASFDALNDKGGPYDSSNANSLLYADSLTSLPFDLSTYIPGDSLYLSFFYQPQGRGFAPEAQDSLMLFMKKTNNRWTKVWATPGKTVQPFVQVMIPVTDIDYFHVDFQFRFLNKASMNINDDVWNLDYIRFDANRGFSDTAIGDVATTSDPSNILNDYTSMPYRHFAANMNAELATQHSFTVQNNHGTIQSVTSGYSARETTTGTTLFAGTSNSANVGPYSRQNYSFPMYPISFSAPTNYSKVVFENKYFASVFPPESKVNDTIIHNQVFDNCLAYDDGTAEKSYFLKQFATLPAKLAIEYHLNQPDTLKGMAVYFGRQVPLAFNKFFTAQVYQDIAYNGGIDNMIFEQQLLFPAYADTMNHFWVYQFDEPVPLPSGVFYLGLMQPTSSGSDSLYYGLDANRVGGNHAYFNVLNYWESSLVSGAVMVRPLVGQDVTGTPVKDVAHRFNDWSVYPNPVAGDLNIKTDHVPIKRFEISDVQGRIILQGKLDKHSNIDVATLLPGMYFVRIFGDSKVSNPKKFIKL